MKNIEVPEILYNKIVAFAEKEGLDIPKAVEVLVLGDRRKELPQKCYITLKDVPTDELKKLKKWKEDNDDIYTCACGPDIVIMNNSEIGRIQSPREKARRKALGLVGEE